MEFGEWLCVNVLKRVPHRYFVFSIPKILRRYFLYDRRLLLELIPAIPGKPTLASPPSKSGFARATDSAPIVPPAPGRLSTNTCWPITPDSFCISIQPGVRTPWRKRQNHADGSIRVTLGLGDRRWCGNRQ